jgi:hypothetical protein
MVCGTAAGPEPRPEGPDPNPAIPPCGGSSRQAHSAYVGLGLLLGLLGLQKLLNDTLLLNQKGTNNTLANAVSASGTTVSTGDALVLSLNTRVGLGSQVRDTLDFSTAIAALRTIGNLGSVLIEKSATYLINNKTRKPIINRLINNYLGS